ncbi:hypothetical protein QM084_26305 [Klebsiella pneumoniae]|uniref:hypothetical protein n=1 Tax=Klebsiella pneumoniae TaxID=573 RepID=UPI00294A4F31|nr:hypothetical protein [Klebsiella pneumoniae]MDV5598730.1 hypothetical protein [Klebsiella pneumoniae]
MLAKEIVFFHGEHAVVALPRILGAAGMSVTEREYGLISEQVVRSSPHGQTPQPRNKEFGETAASKRIRQTKEPKNGKKENRGTGNGIKRKSAAMMRSKGFTLD